MTNQTEAPVEMFSIILPKLEMQMLMSLTMGQFKNIVEENGKDGDKLKEESLRALMVYTTVLKLHISMNDHALIEKATDNVLKAVSQMSQRVGA